MTGNKKGMTLVELIVAMALGVVVVAAGAVVIVTSFRLYNRSKALSESGVITSTLYYTIADELRYAGLDDGLSSEVNEITFQSPLHGGGQINIRLNDDGKLMIGDEPALSEEVYGDFTIEGLTFAPYEEDCIQVSYIIKNAEYSFLEEMQFVVRNLN